MKISAYEESAWRMARLNQLVGYLLRRDADYLDLINRIHDHKGDLHIYFQPGLLNRRTVDHVRFRVTKFWESSFGDGSSNVVLHHGEQVADPYENTALSNGPCEMDFTSSLNSLDRRWFW